MFAELARRGWSDADLAKLANGNVLRILKQAEQVSAKLQEDAQAVERDDRGAGQGR